MPGRGSWEHNWEFWGRWERREKRDFGVPVISPWAATLAVKKGAEYTCKEKTNFHLKTTTQRAPKTHTRTHTARTTQHAPRRTQHVPRHTQHVPRSVHAAPSTHPARTRTAARTQHARSTQHASSTQHVPHAPRSSILNVGRKYLHPHPYLSSFSVLEGSTRLPSTPGWKGDLGLLGWGVQLRDSPGLSASGLLGS